MRSQSPSIDSIINNKSVFPIVSDEKRENYKYDNAFYKLDARVQPLAVNEVEMLKKAGLLCPSTVNVGQILIKHPYLPSTFIEAGFDYTQYLQEKFGHYAVILNYLGAKTQELKAIIAKREKREVSADGKINYKKMGSLKGWFKRTILNTHEVKFEKSIVGTGRRFYEKAKEYAIAKGLERDPFVQELLCLQKDSPIEEYHCDVTISKDYNDIIDAAASLSVMEGVFTIDGKFKETISTRLQIAISQTLKFNE